MDTNSEHNVEYAFHQLYLRYSSKVYSFILRHSNGNQYLAEEVVQTVFMKLWERRTQFDDLSLMRPYLFSMVRNTFYKMCAHEAVRYAYEHCMKEEAKEPITQQAEATPESTLDEESLHDLILQLAEKMPEKRRAVFYKNRIEKKSYNTIAQEMHISEKTVGTHMTMALRYLREHLHDYTNVFLLLFILSQNAILW